MGRGKGRLIAIFSVIGVLVLVAAACAPAATPTPTATPTPPPVVATPTPTPTVIPGIATPTPTATAAPVARIIPWSDAPPQPGGILMTGTTGACPYYDSHRTITGSVLMCTGPVFSSLVRYDPVVELYKDEYIQGDLAERWEISADGKVYTFYLRKGVKWHDGKPFTAKDVKYSLEKLADPKRSAFSLEFSVMERVEIVDDYTVKMYLKFPSGLFLKMIAHSFSHIQPEHLKAVSFRTPSFLVGTGAMKFKSTTAGVDFVLEKNPDFHFKGKPYLDGVTQRVLTEDAYLNAFVGGRLDSGPAGTKVDLETVKRFAPEIRVYYHPGYPVYRGPTFNFVKEGPWQDVRVRKALVMVTDFEGEAMAHSGGVPELGSGRSGFFWGPELGGIGIPWEEKSKWWWQDRPLAERVAEAKRLLAQAGYPNGFKAEFMVTLPGYVDPALLGIDTYRKHLNIDLAFYFPERAVALERREKLQFELTYEGFVATLGDAEQFLAGIYVPGGATNYGRYSHPVIEEIYAKMQRELDPAKRVELAHQAERILFDDIPLIPYYKVNKSVAFWPYVRNWVEHPFHSNYGPRYENIWFDRADPSWQKRKA